MFISFYRVVWLLLLPVYFVFYVYRAFTGKEQFARILERFGFASVSRPKGDVVWFHAASVGESLCILPLIEKMRKKLPNVSIVVTTGTKTSAKLMQARLPKGAVHQYLPWDFVLFVKKFFKFWQPKLSVFVESEFWPELMHSAPNKMLINARISDRSYPKYQKYQHTISKLLNTFKVCLAQDELVKDRLLSLGVQRVHNSGNLKMDMPVQHISSLEKAPFVDAIAGRPVWVVSSTHAPEEKMLLDAFSALKKDVPNLLLIVAPRHPHRGVEVASIYEKAGFKVTRRGADLDMLEKQDDVYVADTIGELPLWYCLADAVFVGGSFISHGGQNPYEPLKYGNITFCGPHMFNFKAMMKDLQAREVILQVETVDALAKELLPLLKNAEARQSLQKHIVENMNGLGGATDYTFKIIKEQLEVS